MAVCSFILSGLQGTYAFYAVIPVSLTFGKFVVKCLDKKKVLKVFFSMI